MPALMILLASRPKLRRRLNPSQLLQLRSCHAKRKLPSNNVSRPIRNKPSCFWMSRIRIYRRYRCSMRPNHNVRGSATLNWKRCRVCWKKNSPNFVLLSRLLRCIRDRLSRASKCSWRRASRPVELPGCRRISRARCRWSVCALSRLLQVAQPSVSKYRMIIAKLSS